ncbi:MAG: hypothetical protein HRU26_06695 [Psychroserpens sp.]|nr:hypothetical protein [Psychroserpens sp.]
MANIFEKIERFFKNIFLDEVDKDYGKVLPYHRKFGSVERQKRDIQQKRNREQHEQSRGF